MRLLTALAFGIAVVMAALPSRAQEQLTDPLVKSFIAVIPDFEALGEKYASSGTPLMAAPKGSAPGPSASPYATMMTGVQGHPAYNEMIAIIRRHGFRDLAQFSTVADRVVRAYASLSMQQQRPAMDANLQKAIKQIEDSNMSAAQKKQMIDAMMQSQQAMKAYDNASEGDKAAVKPHLQSLDRVFR
jgi:hypothetical protein